MVDQGRDWDRAAFLKEVQSVCAQELARCLEMIGGLSPRGNDDVLRRDSEKAVAALATELAATRDEVRRLVETSQREQTDQFDGICRRLGALEDRCNATGLSVYLSLKDGDEITSRIEQLDGSDSRAPAPATEEWPLVCGDSLDLSGLSGLNVSAFILQYARVHRDGTGLHDGATGEFATYPQLVGFVGTAAVGLQAHGFQAGDVLSISKSSSDLRTLVLILSAWRLRGVVAICESSCGDQDTFSKEQSKESVWVVTAKQPKKAADSPTGQQSRTILTGPWEADTDGLLRYEELMAVQPQRQTLFGQVGPTEIAFQIFNDDGVVSLTHLEVIASIERSLAVFISQDGEAILGGESRAQLVWNTLSFSHPAGFTLGVFPAIILGVSVIQAPLPSCSSLIQEILKPTASQEITMMVLSSVALSHFYESRTLRSVLPTALKDLVSVGVPTSTQQRALRWFAAWKRDLRCWRALPIAGCGGVVFVADELLGPIRSNQQRAIFQELGKPLPGISCSVRKSPGPQNPHPANGDTLEVLITSRTSALAGGDAICAMPTGIFGYISSGDESDSDSRFAVTAVAAGSGWGKQIVVIAPVLPIEEILAAHPLVADTVVFAVQGVGNEGEGTTEENYAIGPLSPQALVVFVSLTSSARKYDTDSLTTIHKFLEKKLASSTFQFRIGQLYVVSSIPRDADGRVLASELERLSCLVSGDM